MVGNCWQKQLLKVTNIFKSQAKFNKQIILTTVYRFQQTSPESNECTHKNENTWGAGVVSWKKKWSSGNSLISSLKTDMWSVMLDLYNCRSLSRWKLKLLTPISCLKPWRCFGVCIAHGILLLVEPAARNRYHACKIGGFHPCRGFSLSYHVSYMKITSYKTTEGYSSLKD